MLYSRLSVNPLNRDIAGWQHLSEVLPDTSLLTDWASDDLFHPRGESGLLLLDTKEKVTLPNLIVSNSVILNSVSNMIEL